MKIYLSSTYLDLIEYRLAVDKTLRRMGHDVVGMEQYIAEGSKPVERCRNDVRNADLYVLVVAWRYGYVSASDSATPARSVAEIEYNEAVSADKPVLVFLLDPEVPWPPNYVDAINSAEGGAKITSFRAHLGSSYLAGVFRSPGDLASQVAAAVARQGLARHMVNRALNQAAVKSSDMGNFGQGTDVSDTTLMSVKAMIVGAGVMRSMVVCLGGGDAWWSTRLFLLASLLKALTSVRQLVFTDENGRFAGMASPSALIDGLAAQFDFLDEFGLTCPDLFGPAET